MIDINSKYKTRNGCEVRLRTVTNHDGEGPYSHYPVQGFYKDDAGIEHALCWTEKGHVFNPAGCHDLDLVEIDEEAGEGLDYRPPEGA